MQTPASDRVPLPPEALLQRLHLSETRPAGEILGRVRPRTTEIEGYRPLRSSLEWELSRLHWEQSGLLSFVDNEVPYLINNTGRLSESAAALLFANLRESPGGDAPIRILELGAGTGLFARYFLDAFETICEQEGHSFYDRLTYLVSDNSPRTAAQWTERQLFADHVGHVIVGTCDGGDVATFRSAAGELVAVGRLRAVFCNYVLDVLPAAVVRPGTSGCEELCVRTHLVDDPSVIGQYTELTIAAIRALAASDRREDRARLVPLATLFELETAFLPAASPPPGSEEAIAFAPGASRVVLNFGALACVDDCLGRLVDDGFVLINDYGATTTVETTEQSATQRFGPTVALGLNFPLLENHVRRRGAVVMVPDGDEDRALHTRLVARRELPRTGESLRNRFSREADRYFEVALEEARQSVGAGRHEEALSRYKEALSRAPRDWQVVGEAAEFVGLRLRDHESGIELARAALALNPWYSAWLWNVLGDCLFCLGRTADAHEAYLQALRIHPTDARTSLNLAYTLLQRGAFAEALASIATGLANDAGGLYRLRLLEKQEQILSSLGLRVRTEQERLADRIARFR